MEDKKENLVFVLTKGAENPEMVLLTFIHAVGALTMEVGATVVLMSNAVMLAQKGMGKHVRYEGKPPLDELMKDFNEMGGRLMLCTPCYKGRGYDEKTDLIEEAQPIAAAVYTQLLLNATSVITY
ncbi:MAG: DsrE family protein [Verrucomicrobia bacterium]|nr:DsrE family protein [Verrucomicrobiota bacterium]